MTEGFILGFISWLSLLFSWWHLPNPIKAFSLRHPVLTDLVATGLTFWLLTSVSRSLVAVAGSVVAGLLTNFSIFLGASFTNPNIGTATEVQDVC